MQTGEHCRDLGQVAAGITIYKRHVGALEGGACLQAKKGSTKGLGPVCMPHPSHRQILLLLPAV